jgi:hypothetical protein
VIDPCAPAEAAHARLRGASSRSSIGWKRKCFVMTCDLGEPRGSFVGVGWTAGIRSIPRDRKGTPMNISPEEALSLVEKWQAAKTPLHIHVSGKPGEFEGVVRAVMGSIVKITSESEYLDIDVCGADFNGDVRGNSTKCTYLVCELPNGLRCSFRPASQSV